MSSRHGSQPSRREPSPQQIPAEVQDEEEAQAAAALGEERQDLEAQSMISKKDGSPQSNAMLKRCFGLVFILAVVVVNIAGYGMMSPSTGALISKVFTKSMKSGFAGFFAGVMQVVAFMWLRTVMNYQYKYGGTLLEVLKKLYSEGGIVRLYRGLFPWAILQAPLSRFGAVLFNDLTVGLMSAFLPQVPVSFSTFAGSVGGALWRIVITPIDTLKTIMQTDGEQGMVVLKDKMRKSSFWVLWSGWEANYVASIVGNYPWFVTLNLMQQNIPVPEGVIMKLVRTAVCGAVASSVSDVVSNSIRVVKTKKQTHPDGSVGYLRATKEVYDKDGAYGLFFRGLETRIYTNVLQGAFFTVLWKYLAS